MESALPSITFEWKQLQQNNDCSIPARQRHCSLLYKQNLLILGGQKNDGQYPEQILMFNLTESVWSEVVVLGGSTCAKFGFSACVYDQDKIITYGGINRTNETHLNKIEMLIPCNSKDLTFERKQAHINGSNSARAFHTANIFEDKMYCFGGQSSYQDEDNHLSILDLKNFQISDHSSEEEKPKGRIHHCSAVNNGKLYIYGGYYTEKGSWGYYEAYLDDLWSLDLATLLWQKLNLSKLNLEPRKGSTMQSIENSIFIFGGSDKERIFNNLACYDAVKKQSQAIGTVGNIPLPKAFQSSILYQGKMILFTDSSVYSITLSNNYKPEAPQKEEHKEKEVNVAPSEFKQDMKRFFTERPYPDVTFMIQNKEIPAHKGFLVSRCSYFKNLFEVHKGPVVEISNILAEVFEDLLEYLYCDEIELKSERAGDLMLISTEYSLSVLTDLCETVLIKNIQIENAINLAILAENCKRSSLRAKVVAFILDHKEIIVKRAEFDDLPKSILVEILKKI